MQPSIIHRSEWRNVLLYALFVVVLTTLPYLLAWQVSGDDWVFSGSLIGADDGNSYLGKMRLGARGEWDFHLFYTAEPHAGAPLLFLPYIVAGQVVGLFADGDALTPTLIITFQVMRVLADVLLIFVLYRFIAAFIKSPNGRLLALLLATLGGGFGWMLLFVGATPPEFNIPEGFSFIVLFSLPHVALARAALFGGLLLVFMTLRRDDGWWRRAVLAGLCWLVVGVAVPFYLAVLYAVLGAWGLVVWARERRFPLWLFWTCLIAAGVTLPLFGYYVTIFRVNSVFAQWSAQNQLPSPNPLHYLLAYGLLSALAVWGGRRVWRGDVRVTLLIGWVLIVPVLVYLPINVQRRTAEGVLIPLAILAVIGLQSMTRRKTIIGSIILLSALSSIILYLSLLFNAVTPNYPVFRPVGEIAALRWLDANAPADTVVLSVADTGNVIPAWADVRTVVGHGPETLRWWEKETQVNLFYSDNADVEQVETLLNDNRVDYIFYGAIEREQTQMPPAWTDQFPVVYNAGGYTIYRVDER